MKKTIQRFIALLYKETVQLLRDRGSLSLYIALPLIQLFLFAYALNLTVMHLPTAIVDQSLDPRSRSFIQALESSGFFDITLTLQNEQQVIAAIDAGQIKAGIVIPPDLTEQLERGGGHVLVLLDGSDSFSVQSGYNAANSIAQNYSLELRTEQIQRQGNLQGASPSDPPIDTATRVLYNPDRKDLVFILPGLIAYIIHSIMITYSAMVIVRERENGMLEQLLATPARPIEMIIAKLIPGMVIVVFIMGLILAISVFWFGVSLNGSLQLLLGESVLFILAGMGLGLLLSTVAQTQFQVQQLTVLITLLSTLLTGFVYTRLTMPLWTQLIGNLLPLTYFVRIIRGIMTKGVGLDMLWMDTLALTLYAAGALALAVAISKKRLD